ncbi:MAG TPA: PEP-CTERM sorting domain-containing protein [Myxococcota bacterium]|jgi:hypothetical protein
MRAPLPVLLAGLLPQFVTLSAVAAPTVDGARDAVYGPALAVQTLETGFGDNFSELDAGYGVIDGGKLYLMLTGNIEDNFNWLEIFIDSKAGGQSSFTSAGNDGAGVMDGLVFDAGFTADYHLAARRGNDGGNLTFNFAFADLGAATSSSYFDILGGLTGTGATGTGVNGVAIEVGYDGSNAAGVLGGTTPANQAAAAAVTTGLELGIALSDLDFVGGVIRIMAGVNNSGHNYWSNQFLAGLPPVIGGGQGNLGGDEMGGFTAEGAIDMTHFAGDQFFTVVPEPSTLALTALGMAGLAVCGRRTRTQQ